MSSTVLMQSNFCLSSVVFFHLMLSFPLPVLVQADPESSYCPIIIQFYTEETYLHLPLKNILSVSYNYNFFPFQLPALLFLKYLTWCLEESKVIDIIHTETPSFLTFHTYYIHTGKAANSHLRNFEAARLLSYC